MSRLSPDTRALLDAARDGDEPTAADRARVQRALGRKIAIGAAVGAAAATVTHSAGAVSSSAAGATTSVGVGALAAGTAAAGGTVATGGATATAVAGGLGAKVLVSLALVGAIGAGTVTYATHGPARRAAPLESHPAAIAPAAAPPLLAPLQAPPAAVAPPAPLTAAAASVIAPSPAAPADAPTPVSAPPAVSPLDAELALLQEAHAALRANDGARALRALADHTRRFPEGQLREESEAARVFALCELGRVDEARDVAGRFLREHPRSPLTPRVARACDAADPSSTF